MLKLNNLEKCFESAKESNAKYIGVAISVNGDNPEIIINGRENFENKLNYYKNAYNEELALKNVPTIKIVGFTYANTFEDIEVDLIG